MTGFLKKLCKKGAVRRAEGGYRGIELKELFLSRDPIPEALPSRRFHPPALHLRPDLGAAAA